MTGSAEDMKPLTIEQAKQLGKKLGADGVIVLVFSDAGQFGYTSYGRDRKRCDRMYKLAEKIERQLKTGEWEVW